MDSRLNHTLEKKQNIYSKYFKRLIDIILVAMLALPALLLIGVASFLIRLETGGGAFFVQQRPGLYGKPFKLYKLRSMSEQTEKDGRKLTDFERTTKTGRIIRSLSIDELPQLLNILKGDMSFIGPRPLLMQYLPLYTPEQLRRHFVRPGISGWAQVNGRNAIGWNEKFKLDTWYVDNVSFGLDLKIAYLTILNIIKRKGINSNKSQTMEIFTGKTEVDNEK